MKSKQKLRITTGLTIVSLAFILSNLRATMFVYLYPDTTSIFGPAWIEIGLWLLVSIVVLNDLRHSDKRAEFLFTWRKNWLLGLFTFLALISVFWSIGPGVTLFRALELLFATLVASYIGIQYLPEQLMESLFWFGAIMLILCVAIVFYAPGTGIMDWSPYNGAWRGLYWNRNHLASIVALLNALYLFGLVRGGVQKNPSAIVDGFFYLLSLMVLYFAKSATGYILVFLLHGCITLAWIWLKVNHHLRPPHYYLFSALAVVALVLVFSNLDSIFGLFNRSTSLTGRIPLWQAILSKAVAQRPWLGLGFGAAWSFEAFRIRIMQHAGWEAQPLIGDNGYLDILLHLGVVGLGLFLTVFFTLMIRSIQYGIQQKSLNGFFPLVLVVYALLANITFSLFAETEVFVWVLIVAALFMTTPPDTNSPPQS